MNRRSDRHAARLPIARSRIRLSPVAAAVSTLLLTAASAHAQTGPSTQAAGNSSQTIVVTGIRRAIETSIATKRNADQIVEAVSAEDIGKLPDASIADSIARLPGLAAQRIDGRPSAISIRGLGPEYAGALLNGRQVVSSGEGRSAEYDQFPSELVNQVIVYKTNDASVVGQGLSGTIDIRPVMPLSFSGRQVALGARAEMNSNGGLSSTGNGANGNRFSVSYVDQFADRTIGLALGYARLDSPGQHKKYENWQFGDYVGQWGAGATGVPSSGAGNNRAAFAQGFESSATSSKQVRDGFMAVLEFKPNKDFHSSIDLYYSKFDQERVGHHFVGDIGLWSGGAQFSNVGTSVVNGNTIISSGTVANGRSLLYGKNFDRTDKIASFGWNNEFKLGDVWKASADLGYSRADREEQYIQTVAAANGATFTFSGLNDIGKSAWSTNQDLTSPTVVSLTNSPDWAEMRTPAFKDEIKSLRLSASRDLSGGAFSRLSAGLAYNQRDKDVTSDAFRLTLASTDVPIPTAALRAPVTIDVAGLNTSMLSWDVPSIMGLYTIVPKDPWQAHTNKFAVHEKVTTAYAKLDIDTTSGSTPIRGNLGIQVVRSQQNSDGFLWNSGNGAPNSGVLVPISGGTTYTDVLPSMNLVFELQPDLVARVGIGKQMARPRMDDMRASADQPRLVAVTGSATVGTWQANGGGKPDLKPWRAIALDWSLEKYFGKRSYVAAAGFYKDLQSFIYTQTTVRDFSGFPNYSTTLTPGCPPTTPNCNPNLGTLTTKANGKGGSVYGLELSASLDGSLISPALDGFGIIASESFTYNSLPLDNNNNRIFLDGFSGVVNNLTFYYEKKGFSARVSQRYRSPFTATTRSVLLNTENSTHIDSEKQIDLQLGYAFDEGTFKGLSLLLQVNNLTNEPAIQRRGPEVIGSAGNRTGLLPWKYDDYGRTVLLGASYKF